MIDRLRGVPYPVLILFAALLLLAPFYPEPHAVQKLRMLRRGTLRRPLDIVDLLMHFSLLGLLLIRVVADLTAR